MKISTGHKFGHLRAVSIKGLCRSSTYWLCSCACGKTTIVKDLDLLSGAKISCGCVSGRTPLNPLTGRKFGAGRKAPSAPRPSRWARFVALVSKTCGKIKRLIRRG